MLRVMMECTSARSSLIFARLRALRLSWNSFLVFWMNVSGGRRFASGCAARVWLTRAFKQSTRAALLSGVRTRAPLPHHGRARAPNLMKA